MKPGGVRIGGGRLRGRLVPAAKDIRPTEGRVREAFFDIVGGEIADCRFLDLFAGSGAVGLEAWSRGAGRIVQVDASSAVVRRLKSHYRTFGIREAEAYRLDLPRGLERLVELTGGGFDVVFIDPPYAFEGHDAVVAALPSLLAAAGVAVLEHSARRSAVEPPAGMVRRDERRYGDCGLSFYGYDSSAAHGSADEAR